MSGTIISKEAKQMDFRELYEKARSVTKPVRHNEFVESGVVGAAILTDAGNVYVGVNIDTACSMGFCAEHAAAAAMLTAGERIIRRVIAVGYEGNIMPPCGRCREFMSQLADENAEAEVMVNENTIVRLKDLLPYSWR
jgi:cytidine deaminase